MDVPFLSNAQSSKRIRQLVQEGYKVTEGEVNGERVVIKKRMPEGQPGSYAKFEKAPPGPVFEAEMDKAGSLRAIHYDAGLNPDYIQPLKNKQEVTNTNFGRSIETLSVVASDEPVAKPTDMTRQIPRFNLGTQMGYNDPMRVAAIEHNVNHVPRRKPAVIHGVNSLSNSKAAVITGEAEFFGTQQGVVGLRDTLNYDPLDQLKKDMLRINKADAVDEITAKSGLHNTNVSRSRTRKRAGKIYV